MNKCEWVKETRIQTENGERWLLQYYVHINATSSDVPVYGLRVDKCTENGQLAETETTPAFTASYAEAMDLAHRFAKATVFPCTLNEMVDEWAVV